MIIYQSNDEYADGVGNNNIKKFKTEHYYTTHTVEPECRSNKNHVIVFTSINACIMIGLLTCELSIKNLFPRFHTVFTRYANIQISD